MVSIPVDLFWMIGLPKQTQKSVMDTIDYCGYVLDRFGEGRRLSAFISHGYRILFRTLEEHRQALLAPSWKYMLNYETKWMNRDQIVAATCEAGRRLNQLKAKHGLIPNKVAQAIDQWISMALKMLHRIDEIVAKGDYPDRDKELSSLKPVVDEVSMSTVCEKKELKLPTPLIKLRLARTLWSMMTRR